MREQDSGIIRIKAGCKDFTGLTVGSKIPLILIKICGDMQHQGEKINQQKNQADNPENLFPIIFPAKSVEKSEPQNSKDGLQTILPNDLFTFLVSPPAVTNRDFINAKAFFGNLHCKLRFKAEPV